MNLLLPLLAIAAVTGTLSVMATWRWLGRRDHRCSVCTLTRSCRQCDDVLRGAGRGGHMKCACGALSSHLTGVDLLHWSAEHHGERLPPLPVPPDQSAGHFQSVGRDESTLKPQSNTRAAAGKAAEAEAFVALLDEMSDAERRAIVRARRNPDPITPQLIREARTCAESPAGTASESPPLPHLVGEHPDDVPSVDRARGHHLGVQPAQSQRPAER
jgi:hypothetical protein